MKERILIKLSGEALMGNSGYGIDVSTINFISKEIKKIAKLNYEICLIIGGGNIFRGVKGASEGIDRSTSDYMGMLATIMNALSLQSCLEQINLPTRVQSAISMSQIAEPYIKRKAVRHLEKNRIVIFAAGTGNPMGIQGSAWSSTTPHDTDYHHYVIVMDGAVARLYNNGEAHSTKNYTSYQIQSLNIGGRNTYRWFGDIPIFKLYDRALTAAEVLQNYKATKSRFA